MPEPITTSSLAESAWHDVGVSTVRNLCKSPTPPINRLKKWTNHSSNSSGGHINSSIKPSIVSNGPVSLQSTSSSSSFSKAVGGLNEPFSKTLDGCKSSNVGSSSKAKFESAKPNGAYPSAATASFMMVKELSLLR